MDFPRSEYRGTIPYIMVQVLRLLRRLPVAEKIQDIAIFINRELLPFLQELRESTAATFEQVTTNTLLGRDTPGTGDVEEITLDDTLEFTGSQVIQRAAITGDVTIPAGSNVSTIPTLAGILSDITALESAEYVTYAANGSLTNERVLTSGTNTVVDITTPAQAKINVDDFPLTGLADQNAETFNGNFTSGLAPQTARAGTSVAGAGLTYTAGGTLSVGAGTGITVAADSVSITLPAIQTQSVTGTLNAHVLPTALAHGDTLIFSPTGATTLNGIDLQNALAVDWPEGFEFILHNSSASFDVTVIDEAGTASALDRISTPVNQTIILGQSCSLIMRRFVTRWGAIERGWPTASTSLTYSGAQLQRAALTGDVTASANSNVTTIANDAVTTVKILNNNVTLAKIETLAARTLISNNTLSTATATEVPHTDLIIKPDLIDCFVGGVASTTLPMSSLGWLYRDITGTGTIIRNGSSGTDGIYRIGTGGVANNACSFTLGDTATSQILTPTQFKYTEFKIDLQASTSTRIQIGFMQNTGLTTSGTAACVFLFDTIDSPNWQTLTRAASTNTTKTSSIAVGTSLTTLGIATDFSGPTIRFYVNDVLAATHTALENIPLTDMNVGIRLETYTGSARTCDFSRFIAIRRLDARSIPEV
jgi:hypothetical protein